jgi:hypothetical protein
MATRCRWRWLRRAIPFTIGAGLLAVPAAVLFCAVRKARDAAHAATTS